MHYHMNMVIRIRETEDILLPRQPVWLECLELIGSEFGNISPQISLVKMSGFLVQSLSSMILQAGGLNHMELSSTTHNLPLGPERCMCSGYWQGFKKYSFYQWKQRSGTVSASQQIYVAADLFNSEEKRVFLISILFINILGPLS